jgi:molecular chaperone DnaK (HSP70)
MEDIDFKLEITRDTLHELNEDFFARVSAPIDQALRTSAMNLEDINEVTFSLLVHEESFI